MNKMNHKILQIIIFHLSVFSKTNFLRIFKDMGIFKKIQLAIS